MADVEETPTAPEETSEDGGDSEATPDAAPNTDVSGPPGDTLASNEAASSTQPLPESDAVSIPEKAAPAAQPKDQAAPPPAEAQSAEAFAPQPINAIEHLKDDALYSDDLAKGHIKPKTYQDLYQDSGTLGKIGTIFGLLLSGAGSGLSHQPNMFLEMMNKELERDLEAQKASASNRQNFYNVAIAHENQKTMAQRSFWENQLKQAEIARNPYMIAQAQANIKNINADTQSKVTQTALTKAQLSALDYLQKKGQGLPAGPVQDNYEQTLSNVVTPALQKDIQNRYGQMEGQSNLRYATTAAKLPKPPIDHISDAVQNPIDSEKLNTLAQQGQMAERLGMPGGMRGADIATARQESQSVHDNRVAADLYNHAFDVLNKAALAKTINPELYKSVTGTLSAEVARQTAGRYNLSEADTQAGGMFPAWNDWGKARSEKYNNAMKFFKGKDYAPTLEQFKLKKDFPAFPNPLYPSKQGMPQGGSQKMGSGESDIKIVNGIKYKRGPNGEAIKVP